jgi:hypothetical protein
MWASPFDLRYPDLVAERRALLNVDGRIFRHPLPEVPGSGCAGDNGSSMSCFAPMCAHCRKKQVELSTLRRCQNGRRSDQEKRSDTLLRVAIRGFTNIPNWDDRAGMRRLKVEAPL